MAWIEKRGNKYRVYWDVGTPENRKRRMMSFNTSEEADQFKKKIEYETSIGLCYDLSNMSFGEYLDYWLKLHRKDLELSTLQSYENTIKNHIKPHLGRIKLIKLGPLHLENYYNFLLEEGRVNRIKRRIEKLEEELQAATSEEKEKLERRIKKAHNSIKKIEEEGNTGLSRINIEQHHRIIHAALNQAVLWQMVPRNVADAVKPPKVGKYEITYLQKEQVNKFIDAIKGSPDYPIIATAIFTGMRRGEILGLRWQDVDFGTGIIHVRQQSQYLPGPGYFFKKPKRNSERDIPIPLPLSYILRQVKKEQDKIKQIYEESHAYQDHDLVFCRPDGTPLDGNGVRIRLKKLLKKHNLPEVRFHALRHTFATMCRAAGLSISDVQDLLGHADISTTKKLYTHVEIEPLKKAMDKFMEYLES